MIRGALLALGATLLFAFPGGAAAQQLDMSRGGPIDVTATNGIDWRQNERMVIARGDARAVRDNVTVLADTLTAWYRPKADAAAQPQAAGATDTGGSEIYKLEALGNVRIFTPTDQVRGDRAVYDIDQAVLVMAGRDMKLTTPTQMLTARDTLEYWAQKRMAVARGDAVAVTNDARRIAADTLVAYTLPSDAPQAGGPGDPAASGKLERMEAFGHVSLRTATDTVTGERGVYVHETSRARLSGDVRITRGQNQINGSEADVDMKTGIAHLVAGPTGRVQGLVLPNDPSNQGLATPPTPSPAKPVKGKRQP